MNMGPGPQLDIRSFVEQESDNLAVASERSEMQRRPSERRRVEGSHERWIPSDLRRHAWVIPYRSSLEWVEWRAPSQNRGEDWIGLWSPKPFFVDHSQCSEHGGGSTGALRARQRRMRIEQRFHLRCVVALDRSEECSFRCGFLGRLSRGASCARQFRLGISRWAG